MTVRCARRLRQDEDILHRLQKLGQLGKIALTGGDEAVKTVNCARPTAACMSVIFRL
jgi:hypothetical protein